EFQSKDAVDKIFHPEDLKELHVLRERALADGAPFEIEARIRGKGGQYRWFLIRRNPLRDARGRVHRWYGTRTDIEDRKQAEERLRQSERELRQLVDAIPQQVFVFSADWSPLFANRRELEYTGLTPQEAQSKDVVAKIFHPEDLKKLEIARERARSDGAPIEMEARIRGKDGGYRWFLIRDNSLRDEHGHILRWYGTRTDIEDHKRAEEAQRRSEAYLSEAQRLSHTGSWASKPGGPLYWSEENFRIWGFDPEQGAPDLEAVRQRMHPEDRDKAMDSAKSAIQAGTDFAQEFRIL